jgi:hypothetical protein
MWGQKQPHTSFVSVALAETGICRLEPTEYDEIPLCKILCCVPGMGLLLM